ncbi:hypothetical protein PC129_g5414 [Phytophthora cactorum]|uniref:Jacalin-type lectin domain-containing protein n=3 Tax=Phytophthora cactorum TaxID=29920 RepID=A0A8T1DZ75_9STRA|nr:hypothetical protein PC114_g5461 [Phytophthora cactorum]KAG2946509.1 hypothetical protein PC117_g7582 [Phytophthora cactorum]KAG3223903.1 hypothetical protein PC129_g5414 [Phytophthora cactorum]KAG4048963.1 hypothetical protein PC123_g15749 [Phytophthora cactorum]KAG4249449.1 hypothetical protein PC116_g2846 [Phytophthora cactorum]
MESTQEHKQHDDGLPLLDADGHPRDSIHTALLEDKTPEILFHEDAIGDTDSDNEDDDVVSTDGSVVLDDDAKMVMYKSTGKVGSKQKWGHEPLAADFKMLSVGIDMLDGVVVKVEGYYLPEEQKVTEGMQTFELTKDECITKVHLFRVRREIHAIQFVTNLRTSERFGGTKHGELCKAVEAPEGKYIASFFGDISKGEEEMELGVRFADRPVGGESTEAEVAEIDQSKFHKEVTLFGSSQSVMKSKMGPSHCCESCWEELLRSHRTALRLFTCLRAWRYVTLQLKHRFQKPTPREWQQARFFEMELPLHAAVTALNHSEGTLDESFELLGSFYALYPSSTVLLDHQRRPPLYYAIEQHWGLEKLSWLVDKSLDTVLEKDSDGLSVVTHARMNACPEELVIRLAVAAASRCILALDELLNGQHFESARRLCHRALQDFFAGVPKFPHARCREVLGVCRKYDEGHAYAAAMAIRDVWMHYTDTWGHFGAPLIQRDLPETLFPVIQSFVEVALVAKGEPLNYQWFVQQDGQDDGIPIDGATQSFIFISPSIQPHNEGVYYCEIANRVGRVVSTRMVVRVVDDRVPSDPTLNFVVDRALLTPGGHTMHCLKASAGGRVHHLQTDATIVFQPDFFICLDGDGNDVSDTHGAEIAIFRRVDDEARLILRNGERLASCLFEILPQSMGDLLRPALLWLPHCLVADANHSAVVVEVDTKSRRILRDVEHAFISEEFARVAINRLGTFAVVSRPKNCHNDEGSSESVVERARIFILRPKSLSASSQSGAVEVSLALVRDLPNCCSEAEARLREMSASGMIDSFHLSIQENFSLSLQIGGEDRVVFRWPAPSSEVVVTHVEISLEKLLSSSGADASLDYPAFLRLPIGATVCKTPVQKCTQANSIETKSSDEISSSDFTIFERDWVVLIPFLRDAKAVFDAPPATPSIVERTNKYLVLELNPASESQHEKGYTTKSKEKSARRTDEKRTFSPYFYVVEMAVFSPTFWRRYDQTWWFDKTKTNVIDGMYKVVHRGFDTKITISTTAYAGCVRVAWCSVDHFGDYSNPLLLPPLTDLDSDSLSDQELAAAGSHSVEMESTSSRLQQLLDDLQIDSSALSKVYGLPRTVRNATDAVAALLEDKVSLGSCNFELALLLSGYKTLEKQLTQIKLASDSYAKLMEPFLRVQRAIPELERCLADSLPITRRLDELLREAYEVIVKLSSPGWLQYFLMDEWFEDALHKIFVDLAELLASDDCALQCAKALQAGLEAPADNGIPWIMKTARSHLLIAVGRLQEATDQATKKLICRELCHTLHLHSSHQQGDDEEELIALTAAKFLAEFESPTSQQALNTLSQQDSFMKHLVSVTPHDGEKCTHVPEAVHFDLDPFIRGVNRTGMHLVIRVANVSLDSCVVQGKATFCGRTTKLSFVPAAEFERKSRYRVSVREQEILSSLGGTLPERPPFTIYFSTPA